MPSPSIKPTVRLVWRVRLLMLKHDIRSVSALARRLHDLGVDISIAQLGRLIDGKNKLWNQQVIEGLLSIFECSLDEMFETVEAKAP